MRCENSKPWELCRRKEACPYPRLHRDTRGIFLQAPKQTLDVYSKQDGAKSGKIHHGCLVRNQIPPCFQSGADSLHREDAPGKR